MRPAGPPFAHLNLRWNPFGELSSQERAELAVADCGHWEARLRRPPQGLQILGPCGRGKTTHLLALWSRFPGAPYVHVREGESPRLPEARFLFIDDVDHLPRRARSRLFRRASSLVFTTHVDLSAEMEKRGLPAATLRVDGCSERQLLRIVERRIEHARRGPGAVPRIGEDVARQLLERHGDDLRAIEFTLYEVFQEMRSIDHVPV
jgi:hypothetical protein